MIYRSNLPCPDIQSRFKHLHQRVTPESMGHDVLSDFADYPEDHPVLGLYKKCGFWTHDEAAILYACAQQVKGRWLDIGALTGWTSSVLCEAGCNVDAIDPMFYSPSFLERWRQNTVGLPINTWADTSREWFVFSEGTGMNGVCIDGNHEHPHPLSDVADASKVTDVILLHDFWGPPVQRAVVWLMDHDFKAQIYNTPFGVACCWRGDTFVPPWHVPDPSIDWKRQREIANAFPYERAE